jgi:hypothetical protein
MITKIDLMDSSNGTISIFSQEKSSSQVQEIASLHTQLDTVNRKLQVKRLFLLALIRVQSSNSCQKITQREGLFSLQANVLVFWPQFYQTCLVIFSCLYI